MSAGATIVGQVAERATEEAVFKALADGARRQLLDALFERDGQTLTELCEILPTMTRFGVMKHLKVLEDAHLVLTEKVGRSKLHHLNPVPIREVHDRWISRYAEPHLIAMLELRNRAEGA
ncbi:MAG: helix-turn-helix domain-containing protein [Actinomycetota bacterium]